MTYDAQEKERYAGKPVECFRIKVGSTTYLYTSAEAAFQITVDQVPTTFVPTEIKRSGADYSQEERSGAISITVKRVDPVAALFLPYAPVSPVEVEVFAFHDGDGEVVKTFWGNVTEAKYLGSECVLTCAPWTNVLNNSVPKTYQDKCIWTTYGAGCLLNKAGSNILTGAQFRRTGVLTFVDGVTIKANAWTGVLYPSGYFTDGWAERANGQRRTILNHVGDTLTLQSPFSGAIVGESVDAYAGDDRTETTCRVKFNNLARHASFPRITKNPYETGFF